MSFSNRPCPSRSPRAFRAADVAILVGQGWVSSKFLYTALHAACSYTHSPLVLLLTMGAPIDAVDGLGRTALDLTENHNERSALRLWQRGEHPTQLARVERYPSAPRD